MHNLTKGYSRSVSKIRNADLYRQI